MPEEQLHKTESERDRAEIAEVLAAAAEEIDAGTVHLQPAEGGPEDGRQVDIPDRPTFEVELERLTDSETGEQRYELEYEISWTT